MELFDRFARLSGISSELASRAVLTLVILLTWLLVVRLLKRFLTQSVEQTSSRFQMRRVVSYAVAFVAVVLIARVWAQGLNGIATYFGLASAGLAIALQDPLTNFAGWLFIILRRPLRIGDRIEIGTHIGDVVDIRPLRFMMLEVGNWVHADQSTGRVLHIPNGWVFKHSVANYDQVFPFVWNEIEITVTFESDWRLAKTTLEGVLEASAEKTMRYLCRSRERRTSACKIWERVLDAFVSIPSVDFAYPTIRRFDFAKEGNTLVTPDPEGPSQAARTQAPKP